MTDKEKQDLGDRTKYVGGSDIAKIMGISRWGSLLCEECGAMLDVTVPPAIERQLDEALEKLAEGSGFTLHHHRLDLVGRCAKCK